MATKSNTLKKAMLSALERSLGVVSEAAKKAKIDRCTHYKWLQADPAYKEAAESISEVAIDFAESKLFQSIRRGSDTATIFYLKCKGKKRGYVEKTEIGLTDKDGNDVITIFQLPDNGRNPVYPAPARVSDEGAKQ